MRSGTGDWLGSAPPATRLSSTRPALGRPQATTRAGAMGCLQSTCSPSWTHRGPRWRMPSSRSPGKSIATAVSPSLRQFLVLHGRPLADRNRSAASHTTGLTQEGGSRAFVSRLSKMRVESRPLSGIVILGSRRDPDQIWDSSLENPWRRLPCAAK